MGRKIILLLLYSYNTKSYLFPLFEVTGNFPLMYVDICLLWSVILVNTALIFSLMLALVVLLTSSSLVAWWTLVS